MKKGNSTTVIAGFILSGVVIGATIGWFLFPSKRKKVISTLNEKSQAAADILKVKLHGFMDNVMNELGKVCDKTNNFLQMEKALNAKILNITLKIQREYPELYPFIEELPVTIPNSNDPEISLNSLKNYYNSLETILKNYKPTHDIQSNPV